MARLEAVAKAGYYPTPPSVVERVAARIRPSQPTTRQTVRLLDPRGGTGTAPQQLAAPWQTLQPTATGARTRSW
jgi:hypothetical protein